MRMWVKGKSRWGSQFTPPSYVSSWVGGSLDFSDIGLGKGTITAVRVLRRPAAEARRYPWRRRVRYTTTGGILITDETRRFCRRHKWDDEQVFLPVGKASRIDRGVVETEARG